MPSSTWGASAPSGVSLGGYYAARSAAFEPRIRAVAGVSGPYDMAAEWDSMPSLTRETFAHHSGAANEAEARERAGELNLAGVAELIEQPCLVVTGKRDRVIPWEQTKRIADDGSAQRVGALRRRNPRVQQHPVQVPPAGRGLDPPPLGDTADESEAP